MTAVVDFTVANYGSIKLVQPLTAEANAWVAENLELESWQWYGGGFVVDPRYIQNLTAEMVASGLTVGEP
jgi:hypothetical protein